MTVRRRRDGEAERLGSLQIENEIEASRLQDWQIGRFLASQHPSGVDATLVISIDDARAVAHQPACFDEKTPRIDRRHHVERGKRHDAMALSIDEWITADQKRTGATLFSTLLAAFQVLLYRHTGQEDVVVG